MVTARAQPWRPQRRRIGMAATAALGCALAAAAWGGADAWYAADARQQAADHWFDLRRCVLGDGLAPSERPGERFDRIALALGEAPSPRDAAWPERCIPHARALDAALARPGVRGELGGVPLATAILDGRTPRADRGVAFDALWRSLRAADLPLPRARPAASPIVSAPSAPAPAEPELRLRQLRPLVSEPGFERLDATTDFSTGRELRLLLGASPSAPTVCVLGDGADAQRWAAADCRKLGWSLPRSTVEVRLSRAGAGAPALLYGRTRRNRDAFYDLASGQRIWRPRFADAQAAVRPSGQTTIVYAVPRGSESAGSRSLPLTMGSAAIHYYRLVRFEPGRAPANRRLEVPADARLWLLPQQLLWWRQAARGDELWGGELRQSDGKLHAPRPLGVLPTGSQLAAECATAEGTVALLRAGGPDAQAAPSSLVFAERTGGARPVDLGMVAGTVSLACEDQAAAVTALQDDLRLTGWRCTAQGCTRHAARPLPSIATTAELLTTHSLNGQPLLIWSAAQSGLRMRMGPWAKLDETGDQVLLTPADVQRLRPRSLQLLSHRGVAVLLIYSVSQGVYALRIDRSGAVTGLPRPR